MEKDSKSNIIKYQPSKSSDGESLDESKSFKCDVCKKFFKSKRTLTAHFKIVHGEKKAHICNICGTKFARKDYLDIHLRSHTGEKPFQCEICEKSLRQRGTLNSHLKICKTAEFTHSIQITVIPTKHIDELKQK